MTNLVGKPPAEIQRELAPYCDRPFRGRQVAHWIVQRHATSFDEMTDLRADLRSRLQQLFTIKTTGPQVWLENFIPGQIDAEGDLAAGELIFSQSGTPEEAAQIWENAARTWRTQHPDELEKWKNWK